jgi:exopolysaccharide biosynthesis polyprenyl glycosylphosphotransferase
VSKSSSATSLEIRHSHQRVVVNDSKGYLIAKRLMDICGSIIGLVCLSWLFLIVAILIKLEDPEGPVIFKQVRVGKDGKEFYMYKFRSMVTNAEVLLDSLLHLNETTGAMFKMKEDPRVTKIGRFIRKASIDELPQLWNVLKGEMSLVGPRPPLPREVEQYTEYDKQRLLVTPGCTGLWQVSGRSNVGFQEMVELDLHYIRNRSILFDLKIIFKTVLVLFGSKDAF